MFCFYSGLPNYRSRQAPAQEVRAAVSAAGHVQVLGDQSAAGAHPGGRDDHQEDAGAGRHGATHAADDAAVLPKPQLPGLRVREPDGRGLGGPGWPGRGVRAPHLRRHVRRLFHVRAAVGRRVPAEQRVQGLLQEPDGRHEGDVPAAVKGRGDVIQQRTAQDPGTSYLAYIFIVLPTLLVYRDRFTTIHGTHRTAHGTNFFFFI